MPDCSTNYENEITEGQNLRTIKCQFCETVVLKPNTAHFINVEYKLPLMKQTIGAIQTETEDMSLFWVVEEIMTFENVAFSKSVGNTKFLTCADCEAGPIGYHDLNSKRSYIALSRVRHCQ